MSALSDYLEAAIASWINGTAMPSAPASVFVGLFNGSPTDAGSGGTEVTTSVRVAGRVQATFTRSGGLLTNNLISFGNSAGSATFSHWGLFDAASGGNLLVHAALTGGSQTVGGGTAVSFPAGALTIELQ